VLDLDETLIHVCDAEKAEKSPLLIKAVSEEFGDIQVSFADTNNLPF